MHDLVEVESRQARFQTGRITIADIADEVDLQRGPLRGTRACDRGRVEAGDGADVGAQRAHREDEVGGLQRAVAERRLAGERRVVPEPGGGVDMRVQPIAAGARTRVSCARIATTGARRDFSRLLRSSVGSSRALSASVRSSTMRNGLPLALVGPNRASSQASSSSASGTSCGSQAPWQRGSRNKRRRSSAPQSRLGRHQPQALREVAQIRSVHADRSRLDATVRRRRAAVAPGQHALDRPAWRGPSRPRPAASSAIAAVLEHQHAVGQRHCLDHVVRDQHGGEPVARPDPRQQVVHLHPGQRVERAERLVEQQQPRPADQGAGQRHALALAAGQHGRPVAGTIGQADIGQRRLGALAASRRRGRCRHCRARAARAAGGRPGTASARRRQARERLAVEQHVARGRRSRARPAGAAACSCRSRSGRRSRRTRPARSRDRAVAAPRARRSAWRRRAGRRARPGGSRVAVDRCQRSADAVARAVESAPAPRSCAGRSRSGRPGARRGSGARAGAVSTSASLPSSA